MVFPSPVGAKAIKSFFAKPIGIACICIGLGFLYPNLFIASSKLISIFASLQSLIGFKIFPPLVIISLSYLNMRQSLSVI